MSTMAIIPAKGESKGVHAKNRRIIGGKPLVLWTIQQALIAESIDLVVVSSEAPIIREMAILEGAAAIPRPPRLAKDTTSTEDVIEHALTVVKPEPDNIVLLQPTSPVRRPSDIDTCVDMLQTYNSVLTVVPSHRFFWARDNDTSVPVNYVVGKRPRRQEISNRYMENGSIYTFHTKGFNMYKNRLFGKIGLYEMNYWSKFEIDDEEDFALVDWILSGGPEDYKIQPDFIRGARP
tara:strand:- start:1082 stop:1786 length:705 start_codon:yes stop_codon:yes gene_type:complete